MFVIIDVRPDVKGNPTTAYVAVEEVEGEGKEIKRVFKHTSCLIEAEEAEEVREESDLFIVNECKRILNHFRSEWSICCEI